MKTLEERFWEKVDIRSSDECWEWKAITNPKGYGEFYNTLRGKRHTRAHQASWIMNFGEIPDGMFVCHKCDNPKCVNPKHLYLGNSQQNVDDKMKKGRWHSRFLYGEQHPQHGTNHRNNKLSEDDVREIRKMRSDGYTLQKIAEKFGVVHGTINNIIQGRKWSWLK